jgi:transposase
MTLRTPDAPSEAYQLRPDPDEPWRYACPHCGSVNIETNNGNGHQPSIRSPVGTQLSTRAERYYCKTCNESVSEDDLVDKAGESDE